MPLSRQEKLRPIFESFESGASANNDKLVLKLYPPELDRFKEEFPNLVFSVVSTKKTTCYKIHEVVITRK